MSITFSVTKKICSILVISMAILFQWSCKPDAQVQGQPTSSQPVVSTEEVQELVTPRAAAHLVGRVTFIDVRTAEEIAEGKIPEALEIDFYSNDFETKLQALDKVKPYVVYCKAGGRSAKTVTKMRGMGFRNVKDLEGGFTAFDNYIK